MLSLLLIVFIEQDLCVGLEEKWLRPWVPLVTFWKEVVEEELSLRMAPFFSLFHSYFVSRVSKCDVSRHTVAILTMCVFYFPFF